MDLYYLIRSRVDGTYAVASLEEQGKYLLLFQEQFEALSYINTHGGDLVDRFRVDSITKPEIKSLLSRWGYQGVGMVSDPLIPQIKFMSV